jgi:Flp pilus assembly protein CpaB
MPLFTAPATKRRPSRARSITVLDGPRPALPGALDAVAERWASLPPRWRILLWCALVAAVLGGAEWRVRAAQAYWGGEPVAVLVAGEDLGVGEEPRGLRRVLLPPSAVPAGAVEGVDSGEALALALPEGAVLTRAHLDARGPGAGLAPGLRAVPITVDEGWAVTRGGWVDVWVLDQGGSAELVARSRPVLDVRSEAPATALVGLAQAEVEAATRGLAQGSLLLTHAPAPGTERSTGQQGRGA